MQNYIVYKHTCPNGKVYIGITGQTPFVRWANGFGYKRNIHFFNAILKYGWDNIKHEILFKNLTKEEACQKEIELIAQYKSNQKEFGYNLSVGGEVGCSGYIFSEETRKKMSEALKGRIVSEETRRKLSESQKGKPRKRHSEKTRKKMSESRKGRPAPSKGCHRSDEFKQKLKNYQYRPILQVDSDGNIVGEYNNIKDVYVKTGIGVSRCLSGKYKTAGGFYWRWKNEF